MHDVLQIGIAKLVIVFVVTLVATLIKELRGDSHQGWTPILKEPATKRLTNWLRHRGSTTVEVRQERLGIKK